MEPMEQVYRGFPREAGVLSYAVTVDGSTVCLQAEFLDSAAAVSGVGWSEADGEVHISVRGTSALLRTGGEFRERYTAAGPVRQVCLGDRLVWAEGTRISAAASQAYEALCSYVGDPSAVAALYRAIGAADQLGPVRYALQTAREPYGLTLQLSCGDAPDPAALQRYGCLLLALVGNLEQVQWEYTVGGRSQTVRLTLDQANALAGFDVKTCAESSRRVQSLLDALG